MGSFQTFRIMAFGFFALWILLKIKWLFKSAQKINMEKANIWHSAPSETFFDNGEFVSNECTRMHMQMQMQKQKPLQ